MKEQMAVVLRYVDERGCVIERFVGVELDVNTSALLFKDAIDKFISKYGLSVLRL